MSGAAGVAVQAAYSVLGSPYVFGSSNPAVGLDCSGVTSYAWAQAGVYTQILSIYMFFNFISAPFGTLFTVLEKQENSLVIHILLLVSRVGTIWYGGRTGNMVLTLGLFSVWGILVYGGLSLWLVRTVGLLCADALAL